jgi:hypothetical protein
MALAAALTACGGGGGGSLIREVPFTSFAAIAPNETVVMPGISATIGGTTDISGNQVLTFDASSVLDTSNSTAKLTYNGFGDLSGMSFSTPQSSASFGPGQIDCTDGVLCGAENATSSAVASDSIPQGWNYQSYGVWLKEVSSTAFQVGVMSAGAVTPASAVPTTGSANFVGLSSAFYVDTSGTPFFTTADMTAGVNWMTRNIAFSTANTVAGNLVTGVTGPNSDLNLSGTLIYDPGTNLFTGTITTVSPVLTGPATGRFYGPGAEEIGGVYRLTGPGISRMLGAFGGKQQ